MIREEVREEADIIRYSGGEIPEVAFWNSLYHLTEEKEGPSLILSTEEERLLKRAVVERYLEIIKRDLQLENMDKPFYRGVRRASINWRRLKNFVLREGFSLEAVRLMVLERLRRFLLDVSRESKLLDVTQEELRVFVEELSFPVEALLWPRLIFQVEG